MSGVDRREFLRAAGVYAGAAILAPSMSGLVACAREAGGRVTRRTAYGYGPLVPMGEELALPAGFRYVKLGVEGSPMSSGAPTPRAHDGMASFAMPGDRIRLVRNHEDKNPPGVARVLDDPERAYDPTAGGGTTTLELRVDAAAGPVIERDFVSLCGTTVNCAGGPTPWGAWLSCEETTQGLARGWRRPHGYVFEVRADADAPGPPVPLRHMGRFVHEAVAVDPVTGVVYETEDVNRRAGFYRFTPNTPAVLRDGGRLEMLAIDGDPEADLRAGRRVGERLPVTWVEIPDPDPADAESQLSAVYLQGRQRGGARLSRLEGCWAGDDSIYFHSTNGGDAHSGQVWRYLPREHELMLVFESPDPEVLDGPDNVTVSPQGGVVICEDGSDGNHLRGLTPDGQIFDLARNILNTREFAGACFSPDGRLLFVNIQGDLDSFGPGNLGMTLAIWGPWEDGPL